MSGTVLLADGNIVALRRGADRYPVTSDLPDAPDYMTLQGRIEDDRQSYMGETLVPVLTPCQWSGSSLSF